MKTFLMALVMVMLLVGSALAVDIPLKATWTPNIEPDMKEYRLYRTDLPVAATQTGGTRTLIGTIPHPTAVYLFSVTVPDGTDGTLKFVLTAADIEGNQSLDSMEAVYPFDFKPPVAPTSFGVQRQ